MEKKKGKMNQMGYINMSENYKEKKTFPEVQAKHIVFAYPK